MTQQTTEQPEAIIASAVQRVKDGLEPPLIYLETVTATGIDPEQPVPVPVVNLSRRQKQRTGKLTSRVWGSLDSEGNVMPGMGVPISAVNTNELPLIEPVGEPEADGVATE